MKRALSKPCAVLLIATLLLALPASADRWLTFPSGWGQQPDPAADAQRRADEARRQADAARKQEAERAVTERENKRKDLERIIQNAGPDAYRKYSDGTIVYLGLLLYMRHGFITNSDPAHAYLDRMALIDTGYHVEDVAEEGCRIVPLEAGSYQDRNNTCFVLGLKASSGRTCTDILMVRLIGDYTYRTATGSSRTISKLDAGERATKEEYTEFFWKKSR